MTVNNVMVLNW